MAKLYITQYARQGRDDRGPILAGEEPNLGTLLLDVTGGAQTTPALNPATRLVRCYADAAIAIAFGSAPVASPNDVIIAAGRVEYFGVDASAVRAAGKFNALAV